MKRIIFIDCRWNCRGCNKTYPSRRQMERHHQDVHGDVIRCNTCSFDLPRSRKYLMTQHFEQRHPGAKVCYTIHPRKEGQSSSSPSLLYQPRKYSRHPSRRKTTEQKARKPSSEAGKTAKNNKSATPGDISPLRSPSLSISLHGSKSIYLHL